jgi:hypothetical protein
MARLKHYKKLNKEHMNNIISCSRKVQKSYCIFRSNCFQLCTILSSRL